mmetsp:Transcript_110402/g.219447  ORF Transcript_110402/g.219447 Transcript_110402/m.219447 type:complete len:375 (-) Transcript_110402:83-1207(-)
MLHFPLSPSAHVTVDVLCIADWLVGLEETTLHAVFSLVAKRRPSFIASIFNWAKNEGGHVCHGKADDIAAAIAVFKPAVSQLASPECSALCLEEADAVAQAQACGSTSATKVLGRAKAHRLTLDCSSEQPGGPSEEILQAHDQDSTAKWMHSGSNSLESEPSKCSSACSASLDASIEHDTESDGCTPGSFVTCSISSSTRSSNSHGHSCAQPGNVAPDDDVVDQHHSLRASPVMPPGRLHGLVFLLRHEFLKYGFLGKLDFQAWFLLRRVSPATAATLPCNLIEDVARHTPWSLTAGQMHADILRGVNDANLLFIYLMRMRHAAPFRRCFQEIFDAVKTRRWILGSKMMAESSAITVSWLDEGALRCMNLNDDH